MKKAHDLAVITIAAWVLMMGSASPAFSQLHAVYSPSTDITLQYYESLPISVQPLWDNFNGSQFSYWLSRDGSSQLVIDYTNITRPNSFSTTVPKHKSPEDTYHHEAEWNPFQFEELEFELTRCCDEERPGGPDDE